MRSALTPAECEVASPADRCRRNDDFRVLFDSVTKDIHRYLARQCEPQDAEDLTADIMTAIYSRWSSAPSTLEAQRKWAFGFARNRIMQESRRRSRTISVDHFIQPEQTEAITQSVEARTIASDRARRLLARLPTKEREALYLRIFAGFNSAETAEILGVTTSAVTTRLNRAKRHLQTIIEREELQR